MIGRPWAGISLCHTGATSPDAGCPQHSIAASACSSSLESTGLTNDSSTRSTIGDALPCNASVFSSVDGTASKPETARTASSVRFSRNGRYASFSLIGTGAYGQVYQCVDVETRREVAMKIAKKDPAYRRCAITESRVLRSLRHCSEVVKILDVFEEEGHVCIVLEKLHQSLHELFKSRGCKALSLVEISAAAKNVFRGLAALHELGYMHCDVKPENIMTINATSSYPVKLIDFGSARSFSRNDYFDIQSLWYRAPEVLRNVPYTVKIDAWSVGCVLFELAAARPLFAGTAVADQIERIESLCGNPADAAGAKRKPQAAGSLAEYMSIRIDRAQPNESVTEKQALVDLLCQLLCVSVKERLSCQDAISHPFVSHTTPTFSTASAPRSGEVIPPALCAPTVHATLPLYDPNYNSQHTAIHAVASVPAVFGIQTKGAPLMAPMPHPA